MRNVRRGALVLAVAIAAQVLSGGIRGPGRYSGVVFFDRWDNCYLFSGVYLMYIAQGVKEALRPYAGRSMEIDATDVYQPINPGDGLVQRYAVLGESKEKARTPAITGVQLHAAVYKAGGAWRATVEVRNGSHAVLAVQGGALGFTVIAYGKRESLFCPSDGTSCAVITRTSATSTDGTDRVGGKEWNWQFERIEQFPNLFTLRFAETRKLSVILHLPAGSYQFMAGYGGGVLEGPYVASNAVSFDIGHE